MTKNYWHITKNNDGLGDDRSKCVLRAHRRLIDALKYASGPVICLVQPSGTILENGNKTMSTELIILSMTTADEGVRILQEFARWCALSVASIWNMPDTVKHYLESGDPTYRDMAWEIASDVACTAAWDTRLAAANAAASAAAGMTAWVAARDAARDAASAMAKDAAWVAAWATARDAAKNAAKNAAEDSEPCMAWTSAWAETWNSTQVAQNEKLTSLVLSTLEKNP